MTNSDDPKEKKKFKIVIAKITEIISIARLKINFINSFLDNKKSCGIS